MSLWQSASSGHIEEWRRAPQWRPTFHWARTWPRGPALGPQRLRRSRQSTRTQGRKPDRWVCAYRNREGFIRGQSHKWGQIKSSGRQKMFKTPGMTLPCNSTKIGHTMHSANRGSWQRTTYHRRSCHWSSRAMPVSTTSQWADPA